MQSISVDRIYFLNHPPFINYVFDRIYTFIFFHLYILPKFSHCSLNFLIHTSTNTLCNAYLIAQHILIQFLYYFVEEIVVARGQILSLYTLQSQISLLNQMIRHVHVPFLRNIWSNKNENYKYSKIFKAMCIVMTYLIWIARFCTFYRSIV